MDYFLKNHCNQTNKIKSGGLNILQKGLVRNMNDMHDCNLQTN